MYEMSLNCVHSKMIDFCNVNLPPLKNKWKWQIRQPHFSHRQAGPVWMLSKQFMKISKLSEHSTIRKVRRRQASTNAWPETSGRFVEACFWGSRGSLFWAVSALDLELNLTWELGNEPGNLEFRMWAALLNPSFFLPGCVFLKHSQVVFVGQPTLGD